MTRFISEYIIQNITVKEDVARSTEIIFKNLPIWFSIKNLLKTSWWVERREKRWRWRYQIGNISKWRVQKKSGMIRDATNLK